MNVPECVLKRVSGANDVACVSAREEMAHGPIWTGDMGGEPNEMDGIISETAPALRHAVCEVRSLFCERPKHMFADRKPTLKRLALGTRHQR